MQNKFETLTTFLKDHAEKDPYCGQILGLLDKHHYSDETLKDCLHFNPPQRGYELLLQATPVKV